MTEDNSGATGLDNETLPTNFEKAGRVTSPSSTTKPSVHSSSELAVTPTLSQTGGEGGKPARTPLEITTKALDISTTYHKPKIITLTHKDNNILCALGMNKKKTTMTETIKLIAWNCNGIQSLVKKGHLRELLLKRRPTVLALSEIKISLKKLRKLSGLTLLLRACGYHFSYWHPQSRGHGGLHETAIISRLKPTTVRCGWIHSREPDLDGRVITAVYDGFTIVQTYVPCTTWPERKIPTEKARQQNDRRRLFDVTLRRHLKAVRIEYKQPVFWTGDQNVALTPEDVWDGVTNPRRCEYPGSKPWEREACQQTLDTMGFVDAYRRLHPEPSTDDFTQFQDNMDWSRGQGQRIDYVFCEEQCLDKTKDTVQITDICVDMDIDGSDHQPLVATMKTVTSFNIPDFLNIPPMYNDITRATDLAPANNKTSLMRNTDSKRESTFLDSS